MKREAPDCVLTGPGCELRQSTGPFIACRLGLDRLKLEFELESRGYEISGKPLWISFDEEASRGLRGLALHLAAKIRAGNQCIFRSAASKPMEAALISATADLVHPTGSPRRNSEIESLKPVVLSAQTYMEENLGEPILLEAVAEASGVSPRSLQVAFRKTIGRTPMAYLENRRFFKLREALQSGREDLTVGEAGMDCGLMHQGRLAGNYFKRFGEPPSEVLERSKRRTAKMHSKYGGLRDQ
jgi:AraC-like DNA-binding protein